MLALKNSYFKTNIKINLKTEANKSNIDLNVKQNI